MLCLNHRIQRKYEGRNTIERNLIFTNSKHTRTVEINKALLFRDIEESTCAQLKDIPLPFNLIKNNYPMLFKKFVIRSWEFDKQCEPLVFKLRITKSLAWAFPNSKSHAIISEIY